MTFLARGDFLRETLTLELFSYIGLNNKDALIRPRIYYDLSDGFWTKWILLEFPFKFITQEEMDKLPEKERVNKKIINPNMKAIILWMYSIFTFDPEGVLGCINSH